MEGKKRRKLPTLDLAAIASQLSVTSLVKKTSANGKVQSATITFKNTDTFKTMDLMMRGKNQDWYYYTDGEDSDDEGPDVLNKPNRKKTKGNRLGERIRSTTVSELSATPCETPTAETNQSYSTTPCATPTVETNQSRSTTPRATPHETSRATSVTLRATPSIGPTAGSSGQSTQTTGVVRNPIPRKSNTPSRLKKLVSQQKNRASSEALIIATRKSTHPLIVTTSCERPRSAIPNPVTLARPLPSNVRIPRVSASTSRSTTPSAFHILHIEPARRTTDNTPGATLQPGNLVDAPPESTRIASVTSDLLLQVSEQVSIPDDSALIEPVQAPPTGPVEAVVETPATRQRMIRSQSAIQEPVSVPNVFTSRRSLANTPDQSSFTVQTVGGSEDSVLNLLGNVRKTLLNTPQEKRKALLPTPDPTPISTWTSNTLSGYQPRTIINYPLNRSGSLSSSRRSSVSSRASNQTPLPANDK